MVKKCTPCIRRAKYAQTKVDIWLKNVHLAYDVPSTPRSPLPFLASPSFERRPAYPCAALSGIPALERARAAKGCRPRTAPRALLPKLRLDGAGFHPALGPGKRGFLKECPFPLSRPIQHISPPLARATVQPTFKAVLLLASLPSKGTDKEAGRSARTPAPEVALLLPAPACA